MSRAICRNTESRSLSQKPKVSAEYFHFIFVAYKFIVLVYFFFGCVSWYLSAGGKFERRNISEMLPNFSATSGDQLNEALLMQMEVHRRLSDQLNLSCRFIY